MATPSDAGRKLIQRRSAEWREHELRWMWLLDSLEGGERYRRAIYRWDMRGFPIRNLFRHKREFPDPREDRGQQNYPAYDIEGTDAGTYAEDDDYELRRARTPVPTFVSETVDTYLAKIFARKVKRVCPDAGAFAGLKDWWENVDGMGTPIDDWVQGTVGRLFLTFGMLDICCDHPAAPDGEPVLSKADEQRLGLGDCYASYVLPQNVLWWKINADGSYQEVLIQERAPEGDDTPDAKAAKTAKRYRHWTEAESTLYDHEGNVLLAAPHPYGVVPIRRVFDRRNPRCAHAGQSRVESIAQRMREYYNRDSELILSDTTQAHPLLQGPEDYVQSDGTIPIGPNWLLPKKKNTQGGAATYEGFDVVDFPKGAAESLRQNKADIRDDVDREAKLLKPSGVSGTQRGSLAQSGVSKELDHDDLHDRLSVVAQGLQRLEHACVGLALTVLRHARPDKATLANVEVVYPSVFSLRSATDLAVIMGDFQANLAAAGDAPRTETLMLCEIARKAVPGFDDETYREIDEEIEAVVLKKAADREREGEAAPVPPPAGPVVAGYQEETDAGADANLNPAEANLAATAGAVEESEPEPGKV